MFEQIFRRSADEMPVRLKVTMSEILIVTPIETCSVSCCLTLTHKSLCLTMVKLQGLKKLWQVNYSFYKLQNRPYPVFGRNLA